MKNILYVLLIFFVSCATVDLTEKSEVISLPGQSKQQIFQKSIQWITYKFVLGQAVINYKNQEMGRIIAKGPVLLDTFIGSMMMVYLVGTIDCINGKAKIIIQPIYCQYQSTKGKIDCQCTWECLMPGALKLIPKTVNNLIDDYKNHMTGGQTPTWDGK